MAEGVIVIGPGGKDIFCSAAARRILGFDEGGPLVFARLEEKLREIGLFQSYEQTRLMKGETVTKEFSLPAQEGSEEVRLRCYLGSMREDGKDSSGVFMIMRNITEEREAEKKKSDFIGTISHELRTPITAMSEFSSLLLEGVGGKLTKQQQEYLGIIKENTVRINHIVDRLLDITNIETQKVQIHREAVNIGDLVNDVVVLFKSKAGPKHILIRTVVNGVAPQLFLDRGLIIQVLINLLDNAIRFTKEWGKVWVEVKELSDEVEVSVKDTGIGIPEDQAPVIFERFSQLDKSYGAGVKGVGLGLAISKDLIEMHQGKIWVESRPGKGSKFIFALPKHDQEMLIKECLSDALGHARAQHKPLSYMVIKVKNFQDLEKQYGTPEAEEMLNEVWKILKETVRNPQGRVAIYQKVVASAVQPNTNKGAALAVQKQFEKHLGGEGHSWKGKPVAPQVACKVINYPDDAATVAEMKLIEKTNA